MGMMFGGILPSSRPTPYYPTPEEQAMAIPGQFAPAGLSLGQPAPAGAGFTPPSGNQMQAQGGIAGPRAAASGNAPTVDLGAGLPATAPLDASAIPLTPIDLSNAKTTHPGFFHHGGLGEKIAGGLSIVGDMALRLSAASGNQWAMQELQNQADMRKSGQESRLRMQQTLAQQSLEFQRQMAEQNAKRQWDLDHPPLTELDRNMIAAGISQSDPRWGPMHLQAAQNAVDPIHAYPTTDDQGREGLIFRRPSEMGTPGQQPVRIGGAADYAKLAPGTPYIDPNGQHRVKGGATSATGSGTFR